MLNNAELKKYIEESGLKQKYVAEKAGLTERTFCLILAGKRKCNIDEYVKICISLDLPLGTFIVQKAG